MAGMITQAVVLRTANYRENDRMLTLLTPGDGIVSAISRGCRKPKSALMACSEWLVCGTFELIDVNRRKTVTGCEIQDTFYPLREDMERLSCAGCMASVCEQLAQQGQEANELYSLLMKGLYYLAYDGDCDALATTAAFLLKCIDESGYRPRLKYCVHCGKLLNLTEGAVFDFVNGGLICDVCTAQGPSAWMSRNQLIWICDVLRNPFVQRLETDIQPCFRTLRAYAECRMGISLHAASMLDKLPAKSNEDARY